jgi:hypothetical protein
MSFSLAPLLLQADIAPITHQVDTTVAVQVGPNRLANSLSTLVRQTLVRRSAEGYLIGVEVLEATQQATDLFSQVTADLNELSQQLLLRTDAQGRLLQVANSPDLVRRWEQLRPALLRKYANQPSVASFLQAYGTQLTVPGTFEQSIFGKGIYGALFPGVYGQVLSATEGVQKQRQLPNFFNQLALPLLLSTVAGPAPPSPFAAIQLTTTGRLDEKLFDRPSFERMMRDIVDDVTFSVELAVMQAETYVIDLSSGWIASGSQSLVVEVPGAYYQEVKHTIKPVALDG